MYIKRIAMMATNLTIPALTNSSDPGTAISFLTQGNTTSAISLSSLPMGHEAQAPTNRFFDDVTKNLAQACQNPAQGSAKVRCSTYQYSLPDCTAYDEQTGLNPILDADSNRTRSVIVQAQIPNNGSLPTTLDTFLPGPSFTNIQLTLSYFTADANDSTVSCFKQNLQKSLNDTLNQTFAPKPVKGSAQRGNAPSKAVAIAAAALLGAALLN